MDPNSAFSHACTCGKVFLHLGALKNHQNSCKKNNKRLSVALARAKEIYAARKRKIAPTDSPAAIDDHNISSAVTEQEVLISSRLLHRVDHRFVQPSAVNISSAVADASDVVRPTKRRRQLPSRFRVSALELHDKRLRDILPEPPAALPPTRLDTPGVAPAASSPEASSTPTRSVAVIETSKNSFGLFRHYFSDSFPSHDPEGDADITSLSDIIDSNYLPSLIGSSSLGPFPNKSSFLLGEWYWNRGAQKSQKGFKELIGIVGAEDF